MCYMFTREYPSAMTKKSGAQFTPRSRSSVGLGCRRPAIPREEDAMTGGAEAVLRDAAQRPRSPPGPASRPRTFLCLRPASPPSPWLFLRVFSPFFCFWGFFFPYYSFFFYLPFFYCSISAYSYSLPLTFAWPLLPLSGSSCVCFLPSFAFVVCLFPIFLSFYVFSLSNRFCLLFASYAFLPLSGSSFVRFLPSFGFVISPFSPLFPLSPYSVFSLFSVFSFLVSLSLFHFLMYFLYRPISVSSLFLLPVSLV